jgi:hypothetical protein
VLKICGRLKGLILYRSLILPQSRESAKVRAQSYSSGAHRPCSAKAITEGKMVPRSEKLWLLGYETFTIFRLWDPVKRAVRISRNVTFNKAELAAGPTKPTTSLIIEPTLESNAESDTDSNAESSSELTD